MSANVAFPDQQNILDYINNHPGKFLLEAPKITDPILFFKLAVAMYSRVLRDLADGMTPDKVNAAIEALKQKRLEKMQ